MPTDDRHDLELLLRSRVPLIIIETHEEPRLIEMVQRMGVQLGRPLFQWSVTDGLRRLDFDAGAQRHAAPPPDLLRHIKATATGGIYVLPDFHPFLDDPVHIRLIKEIALAHDKVAHTLVLVSHAIEVPPELRVLTARFELRLPNREQIERIVAEEARAWAQQPGNERVRTDRRTMGLLVQNLTGLSVSDVRRLVRGAIRDDGAITESDLPRVMAAKFQLHERSSGISFEYDTARFGEVGGLDNLKRWLERRRSAFLHPEAGLDAPKGMLLVGVQGSGKSLAAKAVAGLWQLPLLRLDVGGLYNKFFGESERNLREALRTAEVMAPCVLWIDEIEKALAQGDNDGGVSSRILGTLLTWLAENRNPVFVVATANAIERLPPELIRKGRLDEIFFVDLPQTPVREQIFAIHLRKRDADPAAFDLAQLAAASEGFSGAEIEQAVVSALYLAREQQQPLATAHVLSELGQTRPLSTVMAEKIDQLRAWARGRTVPA
jgi:SpoVK/Ycf46/Vps4 family AAA+-type ATPase